MKELSSFYVSNKQLIKAIVSKAQKDKLIFSASALTFTCLLSIVPLLSVFFSILKLFPSFTALEASIREFIAANLPPAYAESITSYLERFIQHSFKLSIVGSIFLLASAIITMATIEKVFNEIWEVKQQRKGVSAFMLYWAVLTIAPILLGLSLLFTSYLVSTPLIADTAVNLGAYSFLVFISSLIIDIFLFAVLYMAVPNREVPFKKALLGGVFIGLVFEALKRLFAIFLMSFGNYQLIYGALASIPVFLLWIYLMWIIVLLGAEFVYAITNPKIKENSKPLLTASKDNKILDRNYQFTENLLTEINTYCNWANIKTENEFFAKAADYVLETDMKWQRNKKE